MKRDTVKHFFIYLFLIFGALFMVFPFYWMVSGSFKTFVEYTSIPPVWIPKNISLDNYREAFRMAPLMKFFTNSVIVTTCSVLINGCTTILAAFGFSRLRFPGREFIFALLIAFMMVPFEMLVITNYQTISRWNIVNTLPALIIPFTSSIFYTYILKGFFDTVPDSLYYSAKIDGASNWMYLWRVMVPIARPSLVTIMLLNAIASWNSFMWVQLVIYSEQYRTIPLGVFSFMTETGGQPSLQLVAATVSVLPMIILFLFARKYIVSGVARGGVKG